MRRLTMIFTIALWAVTAGIYALRYASVRTALPDAEGYERLWDWQLLFFSLVRLPVLVVLLVVVLLLEHKFLPGPNRGPRPPR